MTRVTEAVAWGMTFVILVAFAVPWFLWRDSTVAYGLPVWLWWHIGWLALTAIVFYVFSQRAWGILVEVAR